MKCCPYERTLIDLRTRFFALMSIIGFALILSFFAVPDLEAKKREFADAPDSFSALSEMAGPAVVNISTVKTVRGGGRAYRRFDNAPRNPHGDNDQMRDFFDRFFGGSGQREFKQESLGSGFIIDKEGYIVTNNHVVENADQIKVILSDEEEYDAEIVGRDSNTDIALIKIQSDKDFPIVKLGNSDTLKVGEWVVAIGNPFGFDHTVTAGIVSGKGRVIGIGPYDDLIQTDASINPGNSGGPLLNTNGEVIGINSAIIASGQGIGFAIPITLAKGVINQLRDKGEVTRGWLGVVIQDLTEGLADYYGLKDRKGALVTSVIPGDPADEAGIRESDIILEIDGKQVEDMKAVLALVAGAGVGEELAVKVYREGDIKTHIVKIGLRDDEDLTARGPRQRYEDSLGLSVSDITPDMTKRYNITETEGVIVTGVKSGGKSAEAGIQIGDIIKEINRQQIKSPEDYHSVIQKVDKDDTIMMYIRRISGRYMIVKLQK